MFDEVPARPITESVEFLRVQRRSLRVFGVLVGLLLVAILIVESMDPEAARRAITQLAQDSFGWRFLVITLSVGIFLLARSIVLVLWAVVAIGLVRLLLHLSARWSWQRIILIILVLGLPAAILHLIATLGSSNSCP